MDEGKEPSELEEILHSIPEKLDDLFDKIFKEARNTTEQQQRVLIRLAQWTLCSFRLLALEELDTALRVQSTTSS